MQTREKRAERPSRRLIYLSTGDVVGCWRARLGECRRTGHQPFMYGTELGGTYCLRCHWRSERMDEGELAYLAGVLDTRAVVRTRLVGGSASVLPYIAMSCGDAPLLKWLARIPGPG